MPDKMSKISLYFTVGDIKGFIEQGLSYEIGR